ncbi:MAG: ATP-binding protein [Pyrinomonadaceae bacterium]
MSADEFVGRAAELQQIVRHAMRPDARGLLLLLAPPAGVSELLRQSYDELFKLQGNVVPVYFALTRNDVTAVEAARQFFQTFVRQCVAFRRNDPALAESSATLNDLAELSTPADFEWIERLLESYHREVNSGDDRSLIRFCFGAPQRVGPVTRVFTMIDCVQLAEQLGGKVALGPEIADVFMRSSGPFALAGLRRQILDVVHRTTDGLESVEILRLEKLSDEDTRALIGHIARRQRVRISDEVIDLLAQQLDASPFFITAMVQAARDRGTPLTSFLECQRLYVDELMGGIISRHFSSVLDEIVPQPNVRKSLLRVLHETAVSDGHKSSLWTWKKRLGVESDQFQRIMHLLHIHELANSSTTFVELGESATVWTDYLRTRYRIEVTGESRALVVASTLLETLRRAPRTMERKYRQEAALGLRDLLARFNSQRVPATLLQYDRFRDSYKGVDDEELNAGLEAEPDLVRLPQVAHVASCASFVGAMRDKCDEERCAVAHGFDPADYTPGHEIVWLAAEVESKLEASRELTAEWLDRLNSLAQECSFSRVKLWLVSNEGFAPEACELLNEREAYSSSRRQLESLTARVHPQASIREAGAADEYEMVIPMGADTELIAAHTAEQIARRINFRPEAINQIKTAVVEACINAAEHSLSPDRKIYQRFKIENDKLVVTISSRGVMAPKMQGTNGQTVRPEDEGTKERRGWGLQLIQTLMDEVEFEQVDDGTRLRMTKYVRK